MPWARIWLCPAANTIQTLILPSVNLSAIDIRDYAYELPEDRIANQPLTQRDQSKLLVCKGGRISHETFKELPNLLPNNTTLFFNDTKVIRARFRFVTTTGAHIEVFLLNPISPSTLLSVNLATKGVVTWKCLVGNIKRWKPGSSLTLNLRGVELKATLLNRDEGIVQLEWFPTEYSFGEIIEMAGVVPLPPYIRREADEKDLERYQTVYAAHSGAVAAPTAGLHFTDTVIGELRKKGIQLEFLTLHVSAGTFMPVKAANAIEHDMHAEQIVVSRQSLEALLQPNRMIVAVGTTAMRTLESLYWFGVKLQHDPDATFLIEKLYPYTPNLVTTSANEAIQNIIAMMERQGISEIAGSTSIYMFPGYQFKICRGLITNFHQPQSTLLLLVAAFIGPIWKDLYREAMLNQYRFLSYGDSSLLIP
ncbi:MAG: S-adenosylmethionine:tRNA ribosyltransferase-isomerase [Bacteroidetes bacterium]|nr:S-adenosylmethionine:tRNA ribosyltransferase-isomerase [Bacteroidota bacterium]